MTMLAPKKLKFVKIDEDVASVLSDRIECGTDVATFIIVLMRPE